MSGRREPVACPHCGSVDTELLSLFGQQLMTSQHYCNACRTPFERIKDHTDLQLEAESVRREQGHAGS